MVVSSPPATVTPPTTVTSPTTVATPKTKLTFVKATLSLNGQLRAIAKRKSESFKLRLKGAKKGTYTLKVVTTYHYKVGKKTKTQTVRGMVC